MNKKTKIIIAVVGMLVVVFGFVAYKGFNFIQDKYQFLRDTITAINEKVSVIETKKYDLDYSWMNNNVTVAHAMGAVGGSDKSYTNSLEAFNKNYEAGQRIFEVDFDVTNDLKTVCSHDEDFWRYSAEIDEDTDFTYDNFMNSKIYKKYTPLDYRNVVDLLNEHKDMYIITDSKYYDKEHVYLQFSQIVNYAKEIDETILDRIIPQIYNKDMLYMVMNVYPFKSINFTLYQTEWGKEDLANFCVESGVKLITISKDVIDDEVLEYLKAYGINVAIHTTDDLDEAKDFLNKGVSLIYTDELLPSDFR